MVEEASTGRPPVVVFAFNRPDKLRRVLAALENQAIERLIIFIDGPRNEADQRAVQACQSLAQAVRWTATEIYLNHQNRGLMGLTDNISIVLERHPAAIFLEDDCLPVPGFCNFMQKSLEHYASEQRVFSICGYQHLRQTFFKGYPHSLVSGARFICWGWATWRDRWQEAWPFIQGYQTLFDNLTQLPEVAGRDIPLIGSVLHTSHKLESWDISVALATMWLKKVHLVPVVGLVRNRGLDISGAHRSWTNVLRAFVLHNRNVARNAPQEIAWLEDVAPNCEYIAGLRDFVTRSQSMALRRQAERGRVLFRRYFWPRREVVHDLAAASEVRPNRRALLSYITHPFYIPEDDPRYFNHTNIWIAKAIVQVLNRLGYTVDVIHYRDRHDPPRGDYDLFIGHVGPSFASLCRQLPPGARKLLLTTTSYWQYNNQQEAERFAGLEERRRHRLPYDRRLQPDEDDALRLADGVIGLGNRATQQTYAGFEKVSLINGVALYDDTLDWCPKEFDLSRQHFVFYSGPGNVHKGLDLLLEAFSALPQHLWISARMDPGFLRLYRRELNTLPNIHLLGWVRPRSRRFYQMMRRCAFSILPSCSEGQAQSVLECMNQGLAPVVSRQAGLDVDGFGVYIEPCTIARVAEIVQELSAWTPQRLAAASGAARAAAQSEYAQDAFLQRLEQVIRTYL